MYESSEEINDNIPEVSEETNNDDMQEASEETNNIGHITEIEYGVSIDDTNITKKDIREKQKLSQIPISRVKSIMKMDPDSHIITKEAIYVTTKATELFLQCLSKEMLKYTQMGKRKTILKRDLDNAIDSISSLCFLEGSLEQLL